MRNLMIAMAVVAAAAAVVLWAHWPSEQELGDAIAYEIALEQCRKDEGRTGVRGLCEAVKRSFGR